MKKLFMLAVMALSTVIAKAQYEPGTFSIQPKAGFNIAWLSNMDKLPIGLTSGLDKMPTVGAVVGVECEFQVAKMLGIAAGLGYSMQGTAWEDYTDEDKLSGKDTKYKDTKIETGYITVPVTANIYLAKGLAIKSGVQFGFLTNADFKNTTEGTLDKRDLTVSTSVDMKDDFNTVDISIPIGLSYEFKNHIVIDGRYNLGLSNVWKDDHSSDKSKNNVVMLTVGYKFGL